MVEYGIKDEGISKTKLTKVSRVVKNYRYLLFF